MATEHRPILNPVLSLKTDPRLASVNGGSVTEKDIRRERLSEQRQVIAEGLRSLRNSARFHAGRALVAVRMFDDSFAPTYSPHSIFRPSHGSELVTPIEGGYLAQVDEDAIEGLAAVVEDGDRIPIRVSISRIQSVSAWSIEDITGHDLDRIWQQSAANEEGWREVSLRLAPFPSGTARDNVVKTLLDLSKDGSIRSLKDFVTITREAGSDADQLVISERDSDDTILRSIREYRQSQFVRLRVLAKDVATLERLAASGCIHRIQPVRPVAAATVPTAPDPVRPVPNEQWHPIVAVVDGGLFAASYEPMVAWRAPSLVADVVAHRSHGNRVASLVVHASEWNPHLSLPAIICRVGVAQAITSAGNRAPSRGQFLSYLRAVVQQHAANTKVWNMSFNEVIPGDEPLEMSELGDEIQKIAREFDILPVISVGNVSPENASRLCPPADCEAALSVGGRVADGKSPGDECHHCLPGPGPEGLLKPETSSFSTLRGLGGTAETGSSYSAAVISSVAAHTFHNLRNPSPDLVRALLINSSDGDSHHFGKGWGSPFGKEHFPWECSDDAVTLAWTGKLRAGQWYHWDSIPIPPEFVHQNKLRGEAKLTAILSPKTASLGSANYFATRLQVALQYTNARGKTDNLLGTMREDSAAEHRARADLAKWNPVRHHAKVIRGKSFKGNNFRVCARVFARDLYQFGISSNAELEPSDVAFVLTLRAAADSTGKSSIYNSVATTLGPYVESAVNDIGVAVTQDV